MFFNLKGLGFNEWWRYIFGTLVVIAALGLGQMALFGYIAHLVNKNPGISSDQIDQFIENPDFSMLGMSKNVGLCLMISSFLIALIALFIVIKYMHKRPFHSLIRIGSKIKWKKILYGFSFWMLLAILAETILYIINPEDYLIQFNLSAFIPLLLIAIFILPIQTSLEELVFRGYLMQGLGWNTGKKWIPLVVTSILFGLLHGLNPEIEKYGFLNMQIYYIAAGLFLGVITIMDDGLELALGVHAAFNFFGAVILSYEASAIQTDSIFRASDVDPTVMTIILFISIAIFYYFTSIKYNWSSLRTLKDPLFAKDSDPELT